MSQRVALFPGSFDPFTNGHLDLARRAAAVFDRVVIAIAVNPAKTGLFTPEERVGLIEKSVRGLRGMSVMHFGGLVVDCAEQVGAHVIIRGLRAVSDFEFEFQMALMNRRLSPQLETLFLMPKEEFSYVSSRLVKEVASLGGDVSHFVPPVVADALHGKYK